MDLQAQLEQLMLEKKAEEAKKAEQEACDVYDYMMKDAKEHSLDAMTTDSDGSQISRFKRIMKVIPVK